MAEKEAEWERRRLAVMAKKNKKQTPSALEPVRATQNKAGKAEAADTAGQQDLKSDPNPHSTSGPEPAGHRGHKSENEKAPSFKPRSQPPKLAFETALDRDIEDFWGRNSPPREEEEAASPASGCLDVREVSSEASLESSSEAAEDLDFTATCEEFRFHRGPRRSTDVASGVDQAIAMRDAISRERPSG